MWIATSLILLLADITLGQFYLPAPLHPLPIIYPNVQTPYYFTAPSPYVSLGIKKQISKKLFLHGKNFHKGVVVYEWVGVTRKYMMHD